MNFLRKVADTVQHGGSGSSTPNAPLSEGDTVVVGERRLKVDRKLGEGGFAYVFRAHDVRTKELFAVKRMVVAEPEQLAQVKQEIAVLRSLSSHPRVLGFYGVESRKLEGPGGRREIVLLLEFCEGGTLVVRTRGGSWATRWNRPAWAASRHGGPAAPWRNGAGVSGWARESPKRRHWEWPRFGRARIDCDRV